MHLQSLYIGLHELYRGGHLHISLLEVSCVWLPVTPKLPVSQCTALVKLYRFIIQLVEICQCSAGDLISFWEITNASLLN